MTFNKIKHINRIAILLFVLSFSSSCFLLPGDKYTPSKTYDYTYTKATVIKFTLDGCSWMLQLEDGKKLEPVNLKDEFKKDNLNVLITYEPYKGASICMAGEMVTIKDIKLKK